MRRGMRTVAAQARPSRRALVSLAGIVVLVIAGLLGMHVLGGSAGGHAGHGASGVALETAADGPAGHGAHVAAAQHEHDTAAVAPRVGAGAASLAAPASCASSCADDGPLVPGEAELMACVLALLAGLLVLVPPARTLRAWAQTLVAVVRTDASAVLVSPSRPSLTVLSISRT